MSLPWQEFFQVAQVLGPAAKDVIAYALGETDEKPPAWARVPSHLQASIELQRLEARSDSDSGPDVA